MFNKEQDSEQLVELAFDVINTPGFDIDEYVKGTYFRDYDYRWGM